MIHNTCKPTKKRRLDIVDNELPDAKRSRLTIITFDSILSLSLPVQRLKSVILMSNKGNLSQLEKTDVLLVLNDFLYLLNYHNNTDDFEIIHNELNSCCNVFCCEQFQRNYRVRNYEEKSVGNIKDVVKQQIIDKIHCYYLHSFDIGFKMTPKQRLCFISNQKEHHATTNENAFINTEYKQIKRILSEKHQQHSNLPGLLHRKGNKFSVKSFEMYSFGQCFTYSGVPIFGKKCQCGNSVTVIRKYSSLKDELLSNSIYGLNIAQFNNEYIKATINFNTLYRKQKYPKREMDLLLAMMIYSNYTQLQSAFSKTYYLKNHIKEHENFFFLGLYLWKALCSRNRYSCSFSQGSTFYHGVSDVLLFQRIWDDIGVKIKAPLSTSSSLEVAATFTNHNKGMIIEFGAKWDNPNTTPISMEWISDFTNEHEYFFMMCGDCSLEMLNITHCHSGMEYRLILDALMLIYHLFGGRQWEETRTEYAALQDLVLALICDRLSYSFAEYSRFTSLTKYAQDLLHIHCNTIEFVGLDLSLRTKKLYSSFCDIFWHSNREWIQIKKIKVLFPKSIELELSEVYLSSFIMDDILNYLKYENTGNNIVETICLDYIKEDSMLTTTQAYIKYATKFENIGFRISSISNNILTICSEYSFFYS
eukprot:333496_1